MNTTPISNRTHIGIFGNTNSGKSSIFNKILGSEVSIVSDINGTTTDPIRRVMELLPFGPICLIDTAGLNDTTSLGAKRIEKTLSTLDKIDLALYVIDSSNYENDKKELLDIIEVFKNKKIPYIIIFNKSDLNTLQLDASFDNYISVSAFDELSINSLKLLINDILVKNIKKELGLMENLLDYGSTVLLVIPIDSEAPKDRLILPQVQLIRSCLDFGIKCIVTDDILLNDTLNEHSNIDLVICDSQVFAKVSKIVPNCIKLTSFSILMARQKGNIDTYIEGANKIKSLEDNDTILITEVCTHNKTHEDIGSVKIPALLSKITGKKLNYEFITGKEFNVEVEKYALIVHCGGCMITSKDMHNRTNKSINVNIPITNYGIALAYCNNILERSIEILHTR